MIITLKRTFGAVGFKFTVENNEVTAEDGYGNKLIEGTDYVVDEKDKPGVQIIQANGLTTYSPPK